MAAYWYQAQYGFADPFAVYASAWSPVSPIRDNTKGDVAINIQSIVSSLARHAVTTHGAG